MSKTRRKFSPEDRLSILKECEREGQTVTCRKYNLSQTLVSSWKQKYQSKGVEGLKPAYKRVDPALRALEEENERLKRIIAKQALELEIKTEVLKLAPIDYLKKEVMNAYLNQASCRITELCRWTGVPRSVFYFRPKDSKPGARPSTHTLTHDGKRVPNEQIVEDIRLIVSREFADWGYEITAAILERNYLIKEKKVYRSMDDNNLLLNWHISTTEKRTSPSASPIIL